MGSISQKPAELRGILVALVTPFTDDGSSIDENRLQAHIERMVTAGVHGLVPGGSTGEFTALEMDERKRLVELSIKYAAGRVPVVAGIGSLTTRAALELAKHAAQAGADALMVVPPFYDPVNYQQLREMLSAIHQASQLPIVYYNIPAASGVTLSPAELACLSSAGVQYLKDTSGNAPALTHLLFGLHDQITTFNGWDTLTFYGLAAGAKGSVWGATNVIPELSVQLWDALAVDRDLDRGRALWGRIWPLCQFFEEHNYSSAVKTAMELLGHPTGGVREPYALLADEHKAKLVTLLKQAGLKTVA